MSCSIKCLKLRRLFSTLLIYSLLGIILNQDYSSMALLLRQVTSLLAYLWKFLERSSTNCSILLLLCHTSLQLKICMGLKLKEWNRFLMLGWPEVFFFFFRLYGLKPLYTFRINWCQSLANQTGSPPHPISITIVSISIALSQV